MVTLDAGAERLLARLTREIADAVGPRLVSVVLYGSAAGDDDWVPGRSDLNLAVVVERVTFDVLQALAPVVARGRRDGMAVPLIVDRDWLSKALDAFPMELDDLARRHRVLLGTDVFANLPLDRGMIRRACEHEARATLLRLRARFLDCAADLAALDGVLAGSLKSVLIMLRHLLQLRGAPTAPGYAEVVQAGEAVLGPLPTMRRLLAHRNRTAPIPLGETTEVFGAYLTEVERLIAAIDGLDA